MAATATATANLTGYFDLAIAIGQLSGHTDYLRAFIDRLAESGEATEIAAIEVPCSVADLAATLARVVSIMESISPVARRLELALKKD